MKFGPVRLDEAKGAILAHSQRTAERMIRKGTVLDAAAIEALRAAGHEQVIAARLDPGDVPEDIAADRLADAMLSPQVGRSRAATGRVNLVAEAAGVLRVDAGKIDRLNTIDEALTIGTLRDYAVVAPKDMLATIKIIPFAVPGAVLSVAETMARQGPPVMALHPFRPLRVGLVASELPGLKESVTEKTIAVTRNRVGASAVVDRRDVGPAGVVRAGGEILHFGMPVDPGNLICLGRIGERPALVLPGCARSPTLNGIDFVLSRLFAGIKVRPADVMRMGVGGLLKEMEARPLPRAAAPATPRTGGAPRSAPRAAAVVLAAGKSSRMAPHNKLLVADRSGKPMIARVVDNVLSSGARPIVVVTGHMAQEIEQALGGRPVRFVHAPDYADGLSASLKAGIAAVPKDSAGAIVCLGDMPLVTGRMIDRLLAAYDPDEGRLIVLPTHNGKQGNPILWDRRYFAEILEAAGDQGARFLVSRHMEAVQEVPMEEDAVLRDFDTPDSLATLPQRLRPEGIPAA
jgi:molybdenum cofactor cytidylyltransferase